MDKAIKDIIFQAKIVLSHLVEVDEDGIEYYKDEEAKLLDKLIYDYEHNK